MRRKLERINGTLMSVPLGLGDQIIREGDPLQVGKANVGAARNRLHRVYNRSSFNLGGRFYGGWWQNIPSDARADITIDGNLTVELDFPQLHPTMLYLEAGKILDGDPYDLAGWPRKLVKRAFNTLVNADTRKEAILAIAGRIGAARNDGKKPNAKPRLHPQDVVRARALVEELERKHAPIAHAFGSGAGLRLQRHDSNMAEAIMLKLEARDVPCLPVHDSFRVPAAEKENLMELMETELRDFGQKTLAQSETSLEKVPQYGERSACPGVPPFLPSPGVREAPGVWTFVGAPGRYRVNPTPAARLTREPTLAREAPWDSNGRS